MLRRLIERVRLLVDQLTVVAGDRLFQLGHRMVDPLAFCQEWKDHFVAVLRPRFMPEGWDVISVKRECPTEQDEEG